MYVNKAQKIRAEVSKKSNGDMGSFNLEMTSPDEREEMLGSSSLFEDYSRSIREKTWCLNGIKTKVFSRSRYRAEYDILKWLRNQSVKQYYKKHPKSKKSKYQIPVNWHRKVPELVLFNYMAKEYHFASYDKVSNNDPKLMMFVDDLNDPINFGTYVTSKTRIEEELSLVYPNFHTRQYKDFALFARTRGNTVDKYTIDNKEKNFIPVKNGLYDEKKHDLVPFSYHKIFTQKVLTNYNPNATKDVNIHGWSVSKFLKKALGKDQIPTFWQMLYAIINPNFTADKLFWLKGDSQGSNGKSTLEQLIINIVGKSNVATTRITDFGNDFGLANLPNTLCDIGDNINSKAHIGGSGSDNFHSLVTGEFVDLNIKNVNPFSFNYTGVFIMSSNGFPQFDDNNGIKRRIIPLVMSKHFPPNNDEVKFDYLKSNELREYLLNKALHSKPKKHNFYVSGTSKDALNELMANSSPVAAFVMKHFNEWKLNRIPTMTVYAAYLAWAREHNFSGKMSTRTFENRFYGYIHNAYEKKSARVRKSDVTDWTDNYKNDDTFSHLDDESREALEKYCPKAGDNVSCYEIRATVKHDIEKQDEANKANDKQLSNSMNNNRTSSATAIQNQRKQYAKDKKNDEIPF